MFETGYILVSCLVGQESPVGQKVIQTIINAILWQSFSFAWY